MDGSGQTQPAPPLVRLAANADRYGELRGLGISNIAFKVAGSDCNDLFILENTFHAPGGPPRHLHYEQDEWFYVVDGEFVFEVGPDRVTLTAGESLLAPRRVPHVWASVGATSGRILVVFNPAGQMEAFFRQTTPASAMPPPIPELWRAHGMELLGPPLALTPVAAG